MLNSCARLSKGGRVRLFLIDIAVPRDVDPDVKEIPGVILYNIDDLQEVILEGMQERKKASIKAEEMLQDAVDEFLNWSSTLTVVPTIKALKQKRERDYGGRIKSLL